MHVNKINNKKYIGITKNKPELRWQNGNGYKRQVFNNAIKKYGWNNFEHIILFENLSEEEACIKEKEMIAYYQSDNKDYGYNVSHGGENGHNDLWHDENYRKAQTEERKNRWTNIAYKAKHAKSMKVAMSKDSYKNKQGIKTKERWISGAFDTICCKPVICLETGIIYKSAADASKITGICRGNINKCCNNKMKTASGYHWIFYNDENYSEEERKSLIEKIGIGNGIQVLCVETGIKYNSITEAANGVGADNSSLGKVLKGKQKTCKGYHWKII